MSILPLPPHPALSGTGLILLWDVDGGLTRIDPFIESDNEMIKAGALLAIGIVNSTVRNEHEPALALLQGESTALCCFPVGRMPLPGLGEEAARGY